MISERKDPLSKQITQNILAAYCIFMIISLAGASLSHPLHDPRYLFHYPHHLVPHPPQYPIILSNTLTVTRLMIYKIRYFSKSP